MRRMQSDWTIKAKQALLEKRMDVTTLAAELHYSREYVSMVLNRRYDSPEMRKVISDYLGIAYE